MAGSSNVRAGGAFIELFADSTKLQKDLRNVQGILKNFGSTVATVGASIFAAGAAGLGAFAAAAGMFTSSASAINDMSERTGVATERIQELSMAAKLAGASSEDLEAGLRGMEKTISEAAGGSKGAAAALAKVGLSAQQLAGLTPDQQLNAIADGLAAIGDPGERAAAAMDVLGKAGFKLGPALKGGSAGLAALGAEARRLGLVTSAADVALGDELGDTLDTLKAVVAQVAVNIGAALAPSIISLAKAATEAISVVVKWVDQNRELVLTIAKITAVVAAVGAGLVAFGGAAVVVSSVIGAFSTIIATVSAAIPVLSAVLAAIVSPIGLIVIGVTAAVAAFLYFSGVGSRIAGAIGAAFQQMWAFIKPILNGIISALMSGKFALAGKIAMAGLTLAWAAGLHTLNKMWQSFWTDVMKTVVKHSAKLAAVAALVNPALAVGIGAMGGANVDWDKAQAAREAGTKQALQNAIRELNAALDEAKAPGKAAADPFAPPPKWRKKVPGSIVDLATGVSSAGTFSAREATGLVSNPTVQLLQQQLAAANRAVQELADLRRDVAQGGLAFQ